VRRQFRGEEKLRLGVMLGSQKRRLPTVAQVTVRPQGAITGPQRRHRSCQRIRPVAPLKGVFRMMTKSISCPFFVTSR
jgi:hypothetical protein